MVMAASESHFHVLAVDDSLIDRKLIERLLKTSSYQVTTVDSGRKALEFLGLHADDRSRPDQPSISPNHNNQEAEVNLVITDYCMPGMTGYDLLKKIKESSSLRDIPVVIMSSENVPSRISRCLEGGAEEFFLKPVRLSDVHKLKPHLLKTKSSSPHMPNEQDDQESVQTSTASVASSPETPSSLAEETKECQSQQQTPNNKNKRKGVEECLSPDRTRSRYNNGQTVASK